MAEDNSVESSVKSAANTAVNTGKFVVGKAIDLGLTAATAGATKGLDLLNKARKGLALASAARPKEEKKEDKTWLWVLIIAIGIFFGLPLLTIASITGAFVSPQSPGLVDSPQSTSAITPAPLQCSNARHEAEKVICWLKEGYLQTTNCSQSIYDVTLSNINAISSCLLSSENPLVSSVNVNNEFRISVNLPDTNPIYLGKLQCVGFVKAIEKSLGHNIDSCGNARDYWNQGCPTSYNKIVTSSAGEITAGDLAVRTTGDYGHLGVVVGTEGNIKIIVAQAWGTTGEIFLSEDAITSYQGYLRYKY